MKFTAKKICAVFALMAVMCVPLAVENCESPLTYTTASAVISDSLVGKSGEYNGFSFYVNKNGAEITEYTGNASKVTVPSSVVLKYDEKEITIPVAELKEYAFYNNSSVESITILDNIKTIEGLTFGFCENLKEIILPKNLTSIEESAFADCGITSITIPESVTYIGKSAFKDCYSLEYASLPKSITQINDEMFSGCKSLKKLPFGKEVKTIGESAFNKCESLVSLEIPQGVETIGDKAFFDCTSLETLKLPDSVKTIGVSAFSVSSVGDNLKNVTFGKGLEEIGDYAFCMNSNLQRIDLPENLKTIGVGAFHSCMEAKEITFPYGLEKIGNSAFQLCQNITSAKLPDTVTELGTGVFEQCYMLESVHFPCFLKSIPDTTFSATSLKSIYIPDSVTEIGEEAFYACNSLSDVRFSKNLKTIDANAFRYCSGLTAINLPDGLESIKDGAFSGNNVGGYMYLKKVVLPESLTELRSFAFSCNVYMDYAEIGGNVKEISENAFAWCPDLSTVKMHEGIEIIGESAFFNTGINSIEIPDSVTFIDNKAFYLTANTYNISLGSSVQNIGESAFQLCTDTLSSIVIPENVESIGSQAIGYWAKYEDSIPEKINNFVIYGNSNTEAQEYANNESFIFETSAPKLTEYHDSATGITVYVPADNLNLSVSVSSESNIIPSDNYTLIGVYKLSFTKNGEAFTPEYMKVQIPSSSRARKCQITTGFTQHSAGNSYYYTPANNTVEFYTNSTDIQLAGLYSLAGDLNDDGVVDLSDVILMNNSLLNLSDISAPQNADLNNDNNVNVFDKLLLKKKFFSLK